MKAIRHSLLALLLLWLYVQTTASHCIGQTPPKVSTETNQLKQEPAKPVSLYKTSPQTLMTQFPQLIQKDKQLKALNKQITQLGFAAQKQPSNFWGVKQTYQVGGSTVSSNIYIQDYAKPNSKDAVALGQVVTSGQGEKTVYSFYLIAPDGDFAKAEEYSVSQDLKILRMHSWWSCMKGKLVDSTSACAAAVVSCSVAAATGPVSWAVYLGCVATGCGTAYAWAGACCGCNCSTWCKYCVHCCHQSGGPEPDEPSPAPHEPACAGNGGRAGIDPRSGESIVCCEGLKKCGQQCRPSNAPCPQ